MNSVLINGGFGNPLSEEDRSWIRSRGFHGVRSDYGPGVLGALYYTKLRPLIIAITGTVSAELIVDRVSQICREMRKVGYLHHRPGPLPAIELYNEPDLNPYWSTRPRVMADVVWECWRVARAFSSGITVVTPGVSNLNKRGFAYLEEMMGAGVPDEVVVGFHRYPAGGDPSVAHDGFKSRHAEVTRLKALAGDRRLWCTETGWSAGPRKTPRAFPLCLLNKNAWLSEEKVAKYGADELRFWARTSVESVTWYQINDGPDRNNSEDNFGLRTYPARNNKVLARWMPELIKEVTDDA